MEGTPESINPDEVAANLKQLLGVLDVHDLHIWTIGSGKVSLSAHLIVTTTSVETDRVLAKANQLLRDRFGISHSTLQLEHVGESDALQCDHHFHGLPELYEA